MGHQEHKEKSPKTVNCSVLTVSDTRTPETDKSGRLIKELLEECQHEVIHYQVVKDEPNEIRGILRGLPAPVQVVILSGGTGLSKRDRTYEAIVSLFEKRIDGFGELFRALSYDEIGSAAMLSRATAGIYQGKIIFSLPGSSNAVGLAMKKLILPELGHLARELCR